MDYIPFEQQRGLPPWHRSSLPFVLMHVAPVLAFFVPFSWSLVGVALATYAIREAT